MNHSIIWGKLTPAESQHIASKLNDLPSVKVQRWQGIREPDVQAWAIAMQPSATIEMKDLLTTLNSTEIYLRELTDMQQWGQLDGEVANFVIRELQADSIDVILPKIHQNIEAVAARPGCVGSILAAERDRPGNLLGVTYWKNEKVFNDYSQWASQQQWKDVIMPVTLKVPLRLLTQKIDP